MKNKSQFLLVIIIILIIVVLGALKGIESKIDSIEEKVSDQAKYMLMSNNKLLEIIETNPVLPAKLNVGEKLKIKFRYDLGIADKVQIWARPYTNGIRTKGYKAHGSPVYNKDIQKTGVTEGWFFFNAPTLVDEIRIDMKDVKPGKDIYTLSEKVNAQWIMEDIQYDPSVKVIVEETKKDLTTSKQLGNGALVYQIRSVDGQHSNARTEFHWTGRGRGGYKPGRVTKGDIKVIFERDGQPAELRVTHPDYHEFSRPVTFKNGEVIVWDDIVLERVSPNNSCTVKGRVLLEDGVNPVDIKVSADRTSKTTTNNDGEFILSNLRSGEIRISASKRGYSGLYTTVSVKKGETATCEINGYRIRKAKVRWAFQPDGSKNFTKDSMTTGTAILQDNILDRVSFGEGFKQVRGHSDFLIYQKDDTLLIRNFDVRRNGPAFIEIDSSFDELTEIPEFERHGRTMNLKQGKVYVFRTYDGKNYAKMEVLEIIDY